AQGWLYLLDRSGLLQRSVGLSGAGGWVNVTSGALKMAVNPVTNDVDVLNQSNQLLVNGTVNWTNIQDFALDGQGRMIQWSGGSLIRSRGAAGAGGWDNLFPGTAVAQFCTTPDGSVYSLDGGHNLLAYAAGSTQSAVLDHNVQQMVVSGDGSLYELTF